MSDLPPASSSVQHAVCALTDLLKDGSLKEPLITLLKSTIALIEALAIDVAQIAGLVCSFQQASSRVFCIEEEIKELQKQVMLLKEGLEASQRREAGLGAEMRSIKRELSALRASDTARRVNAVKFTLRQMVSDAEVTLLLKHGGPPLSAR